MDIPQFQAIISRLTSEISGVPLDASLEAHLNADHGPGSDTYEALFAACKTGVAEGWLCNRESDGIKYGRVLKATEATHGFSVDVVEMQDLAGPHHSHPQGEIDLIMPLTRGAHFDNCPAGWCVYEPGSAHHPTVTDGRALVLYLLPQGSIQFTQAAA
jgi:hypothetical protein